MCARRVTRSGPTSLKIALLIDRLNCGGSERQFVVLARALHERGHIVTAMVFYAGGAFETELRSAGVRVRPLNKRRRWDLWGFGRQLARAAREEKPHVLYGFTSVANIAATVVRPLVPSARVIWGVRASNVPLARYGWLPPLINRVAVRLSRRTDLVIANSHAGLAAAVGRGYRPPQMTVIPNGIDTDRFAPDREAGARVRAQWNVRPSDTLVGLVGRLDPMKGHPIFLQVAAMLARDRPNVMFACVGDGNAAYQRDLLETACRLGIGSRVRWVPHAQDMTAVYNAFDVLCSSSIDGEGFPNVIGEAMACETPCVVTDVGDSARVLNREGLIVRSVQPELLASTIATVLDLPPSQRAGLAAEGRRRIMSEFSVARLVDATERAICQTCADIRR